MSIKRRVLPIIFCNRIFNYKEKRVDLKSYVRRIICPYLLQAAIKKDNFTQRTALLYNVLRVALTP